MEDVPRTHDVVIVGGGPSAIGLLLGLLTHLPPQNHQSSPTFTVAIIERGGEGGGHQNDDVAKDRRSTQDGSDTSSKESSLPPSKSSPLPPSSISNPSQWHNASHTPSTHCSIYTTPPQPNLQNRQISIPTGKGFGGTSNINACLVMSPDYTKDFFSWPGIWKGGQRLEAASRVILERMADDSNNVEVFDMCTEYERICRCAGEKKSGEKRDTATSFVEAVQHMGHFPFLSTSIPLAVVRSMKPIASQKTTLTEKEVHNCYYRRANYFDLLIQPLLQQRPDLLSQNIVTFYSETQLERVLFSGRRAVGVRCCRRTLKESNEKEEHNSCFNIYAKREVILCCGAILTPALLLASGIGPIDDLRKEGIQPLCHDSNNDEREAKKTSSIAAIGSGVGRNLRDHIVLPRAFLSLQSLKSTRKSLNTIQGIWNTKVFFEWNDDDDDEKTQDSSVSAKARNEENVQIHIDDAVIVPQILPRQFASIVKSLGVTSSFVDGEGIRKGCILSRWKSLFFVSLSHMVENVLHVVLHYTPIGWFLYHHTVLFTVCILNPKSKGTVTLRRRRRRRQQTQCKEKSGWDTTNNEIVDSKSDDKRESSTVVAVEGLSDFDIIVDPKYLSDSRDVDLMKVAFHASDELRKEWFSNKNGFFEISPGFIFRWLIPSIQSFTFRVLKWWNGEKNINQNNQEPVGMDFFGSYAAGFVNPYYHFCGSCAMGSNKKKHSNSEKEKTMKIKVKKDQSSDECMDEFVVNDMLQVNGLSSLRICDASVFPNCISNPTALLCVSLGYAAAPLFLKEFKDKDI